MKEKFEQISLYSAPARIGIFILSLLFFWLPVAIPIYLLVTHDTNLRSILSLGALYIEFIILLKIWGNKVYQQPLILKEYGLVWNKKNCINFLQGLAIGLSFCLSLFLLMNLLGWIELKPPNIAPFRLVSEGLLSATAIGFAEELLFRGWLLNELERDYSPKIALWTSAFIYGILHFIKPISEIIRTAVTFPGLVTLGLILVWAKRTHQQLLGYSIGLHAGLVWAYYIVNVGHMIHYTNKVPLWLTGIDGNPLAGVSGLLFLGVLAWWIKRNSRRKFL